MHDLQDPDYRQRYYIYAPEDRLGGLSRERAPIALELGITTTEDMPRMTTRELAMRAKAIKLHVGTSPDEDVREIRALRCGWRQGRDKG